MTKNMGVVDRTLRLLAVALIAVLFVTDSIAGTLAVILAVVAALFLGTSLVGWCPLYSLIGVSTRKTAPPTPAKV
jgi:hypothetical protein